MSERVGSRELVLDTSVAVKFHVPEEQHEEASTLRSAFEEGQVELLAPGTILPEAFRTPSGSFAAAASSRARKYGRDGI